MAYYVEMTDTFGGELNYSWVKRFFVRAQTLKSCMRKVAMETGYNARMQWRMGDDEAMYKVTGACIGYSVRYLSESDSEEVSTYKEMNIKQL